MISSELHSKRERENVVTMFILLNTHKRLVRLYFRHSTSLSLSLKPSIIILPYKKAKIIRMYFNNFINSNLLTNSLLPHHHHNQPIPTAPKSNPSTHPRSTRLGNLVRLRSPNILRFLPSRSREPFPLKRETGN